MRVSDWDKIFKKSLDFCSINDVTELDRLSDIEEIRWYIDDCRVRSLKLIKNFQETEIEFSFLHLIQEKLDLLSTHLTASIQTQEKFKFLDFNDELRQTYKAIAGILFGRFWQSPAKGKTLLEKSPLQSEENTYLRNEASETVKLYETDFIQQYYDLSRFCSKRTIGHVTSSGMNAIEVAVLVYCLITQRKPRPVYYQTGFYFEGITLITAMVDASPLNTNDIYNVLDSQLDIGCLFVDVATTWPVHEGIDLDTMFYKIKNRKQTQPMFIVIDRTISTVANQFFLKYADEIPTNVILVSVESTLKYQQFGMDMSNLGFIVFSGAITRMSSFKKLVSEVMALTSAIPDPELIMRLPTPSRLLTENRLARMARNFHLIFLVLKQLQEEGLVISLYKSIDDFKGYTVSNQLWNSSLLFVQIINLQNPEEYSDFCKRLVESADPSLPILCGSSFGFDSTRLCVVEDKLSEQQSCAIRISVGKSTLEEIVEVAKHLYYRIKSLNSEVELLNVK